MRYALSYDSVISCRQGQKEFQSAEPPRAERGEQGGPTEWARSNGTGNGTRNTESRDSARTTRPSTMQTARYHSYTHDVKDVY